MFSKSFSFKHPSPFTVASLSAAIIALTSTHAIAATKKADDKKLETVYVSATRSETAQMPVATQIKIISAEDIRVSGAKLLSEVLRTQAGIQLTDSDGSGARNVTASMRGLSGANNVLVLVDGRKLNNPSLAAPALNTVALKDVERIEIVQGSAGVLYGDQAVGGVINIITRRAVVGEVHGSVSATGGSDNLEDYTASINQGFANGLSYSASAQKRNADNYRDNNQNAYENVLANVRYDFAQGFVFVEGQTIDDELNLAGYLLDSEVIVNPRKARTPSNYVNQNTDLARIGGGLNLSEHWELLAEFADRDENTESFYGYGAPTLGNMRVKNITPRLVGTLPTTKGNALVTLGYDQVDSEYTVLDWGTDIEQAIDAYYAQLIYPLTQQLSLSIGARTSSVDDANHALSTHHSDDVTANELGLSYQLDNGWRVFGRYADGFRFANADENGFVLPSVMFLEAQTSHSGELGAEWSSERATVQWSLYRMNLDNELMYDAVIVNPNSWNGFGANVNLDSSRRQGVAIDGQLILSDEIQLQANYTYTDAELSSGSFAGNAVPNTAENRANVALVFTPVQQLTIYLDSSYTGSRYRSSDSANAGETLAPLVLFNLNLTWQYEAVELTGRIKNLTNERYAGLYGLSPTAGYYQYPQPERNYQASITYRF
ncbi:TonB-dependent receptor [Cellvibrio sp. OA-2007]|uniref:TonB-dependent receptor n=1 Tax=Cellvibrio sp. OA-2007 TaxID=529823 RepID=UPI000784C38C|nr:TonB-dependent receptor [Cellvibrio sp. OA-2007]